MNDLSWNDINVTDVLEAIRIFDEEKPKCPKARNTFLIYCNKEYPAKHIRGMAYKVHFRREVSKDDYSGGKETKDFFERLGFVVRYTPSSRSNA